MLDELLLLIGLVEGEGFEVRGAAQGVDLLEEFVHVEVERDRGGGVGEEDTKEFLVGLGEVGFFARGGSVEEEEVGVADELVERDDELLIEIGGRFEFLWSEDSVEGVLGENRSVVHVEFLTHRGEGTHPSHFHNINQA